MKKFVLTLAATIVSFGSIFAQIKQERTVSDFTKVKATSAIKVILSLGEKESVVFEADENVIAKLKADVKNGELKLYIDGKTSTKNDVIAYVTAKSLSAIDASGASLVEVTSPVIADQMNLNASGAAGITLELTAKEVIANVTGAGSIKVKGSGKDLKAVASGAGCLKAADFKVDNVTVSASGAGSASVNVNTSLKADANGAGSVKYTGEPKDKNIHTGSAGSVTKA